KILERLTLPAIQESAPAQVPQPAVNVARLDALAKPAPETAPASPAASAESAAAVDLSKANEKLSSLLNKPKD
ncbi:MAG TPA: ABC transporter ATP-binding protein, partial [Candidatus Dormibacteraeota bacterium]|nr:ABC transporter ATP-binding protein [Candidatus Dormibacteraeota bacterium]